MAIDSEGVPDIVSDYPVEAGAAVLVLVLAIATNLPAIRLGASGTYDFTTLQIVFSLLEVVALALPAVAVLLYIVLGYVPAESRQHVVLLGYGISLGLVIAGVLLIGGLVLHAETPGVVGLAGVVLLLSLLGFAAFLAPLWRVALNVVS